MKKPVTKHHTLATTGHAEGTCTGGKPQKFSHGGRVGSMETSGTKGVKGFAKGGQIKPEMKDSAMGEHHHHVHIDHVGGTKHHLHIHHHGKGK